MTGRPMHEAEQGLPRRSLAWGSGRRSFLTSWKVLTPTVVLLAAALVFPLPQSARPQAATLGYSDLLRVLSAGHVASVTIEPGVGVTGRWKTSAAAGAHFTTSYPIVEIESLVNRAERGGVTVELHDPNAVSALARWIMIAVQVTLVLGLILLLFVGLRSQGLMQGGVGERAGNTNTTFADVAGTQGAADELRELVEFLRHSAVFSRM